MSFEVLRHPGVPAAVVDLTGVPVEFFGFHLGAQGACLDGFAGIVCPEAGGFVAPCAVGVNVLDKPERRVLFLQGEAIVQCSLGRKRAGKY
jgi:hypothetical protein